MRCGNLLAEIRRFLRGRRGATAIEYALITGGISIVIIGGVTALGSTMNTTRYQKLTMVINGSGS